MEEYKRKLWAILERDFAASVMNTTKWFEALEALREFRLQYRVKFITHPDPTKWGELWSGTEPVSYIEGSYFGPVPLLEVEWLEVEPVSRIRQGRLVADRQIDHTEEIEERLRAVGVPFTREGSAIRIWGHMRRRIEAADQER